MAQNAAETDEKTRYEAAKKELAQALKKKRDLDKQLVAVLDTSLNGIQNDRVASLQ
jgi:hypothetical protein